MPNYDWRTFTDGWPTERFPQWARGYALWREFGGGIPEALPALLEALVRLRASPNWGVAALVCPRVFISHKQIDDVRARQIAAIARGIGFQVWLDVFDPALQAAIRSAVTGPDYARAVAAIIETALINSTHVLAVMTPDTARSRWVPYEYGRVKESSPHSLTAACWIDPRVAPQSLPEYLLLGVETRTDAEIAQWLSGELARWRLAHPGCTAAAAADHDDADMPATTPSEPAATARDQIEDSLRPYYDGLDYPIKVLRPLVLSGRSPSPTDLEAVYRHLTTTLALVTEASRRKPE